MNPAVATRDLQDDQRYGYLFLLRHDLPRRPTTAAAQPQNSPKSCPDGPRRATEPLRGTSVEPSRPGPARACNGTAAGVAAGSWILRQLLPRASLPSLLYHPSASCHPPGSSPASAWARAWLMASWGAGLNRAHLRDPRPAPQDALAGSGWPNRIKTVDVYGWKKVGIAATAVCNG